MELILSCMAIATFGLVSAIIEAMIDIEPQLEKTNKKRFRGKTRQPRSSR